jgi:hypothetical protein
LRVDLSLPFRLTLGTLLPMPTLLKTRCPKCQAAVKVTEDHVHKRVRCPSCREAFEVSSVELPLSQSIDTQPLAIETMQPTGAVGNALRGVPSAASSPSNAPLGSLGRFKLREILGQGAFGRVYRAYDPQLDREVALKVPTFGPDETHKVQRFIAEAKAAARLRHPNIVPTYESGQADGLYYIAAQFVPGQPLSKVIKEKPPDFRQSAEWVRQLADALAYAHGEGIVHRDIKPSNIMIDAKGVPQIMDFGLAKRLNEDSGMTTDGSILGTPAYMSPEQARGDHANVGPASDQYSLGVVLYELLTGRRPFDGRPHAVIASVIADEPPPPRSICNDIPRDLEAVCNKSVHKSVTRRYRGCGDLRDDLTAWRDGRSIHARPTSTLERLSRWCYRHRSLTALSVVTGAAVLFTVVAISVAYVDARRARSQAELHLQRAQAESRRAAAEAQNAILQARRASAAEESLVRERDELKTAVKKANDALAEVERKEEQRFAEVTKKRLAQLDAEAARKNTERVQLELQSAKAHAIQLEGMGKYAEQIQMAAALNTAKRFDEARRVLEECHVDFRSWEWSYLSDWCMARHGGCVKIELEDGVQCEAIDALKHRAYLSSSKPSHEVGILNLTNKAITWHSMSPDEPKVNRALLRGTWVPVDESLFLVGRLGGRYYPHSLQEAFVRRNADLAAISEKPSHYSQIGSRKGRYFLWRSDDEATPTFQIVQFTSAPRASVRVIGEVSDTMRSGNSGYLFNLALSDDESLIAISNRYSKSVRVYELGTGRMVRDCQLWDPVTYMAFSPSSTGEQLLAIVMNEKICVVNTRTGSRHENESLRSHQSWLGAAGLPGISIDGRRIVANSAIYSIVDRIEVIRPNWLPSYSYRIADPFYPTKARFLPGTEVLVRVVTSYRRNADGESVRASTIELRGRSAAVDASESPVLDGL